MAPNLAVLSGEPSGDLVGGALARALLAQHPGVALWGLGSRHMRESGVELLFDSAEWSAIGVVEALRLYPELRFRMYPQVLRELEARRPAVVVLIDFGAFNSKVARWCKAHGPKVLWYFPPGSWRRSGEANAELAQITDRIAAPFPWTAERLSRLGARAEFVGHPLLELCRPSASRAAFADTYGMEAGRPIVGLLPGSRRFEIEHNTPALLDAARNIWRSMPEAQFVFGLAPSACREHLETLIRPPAAAEAPAGELAAAGRMLRRVGSGLRHSLEKRRDPLLVTSEGLLVPASAVSGDGRSANGKAPMPPVVICQGATYDVMAHSDVLIVCSGTATLEAAILGTPMVILYRGSVLMELEYRVRRAGRIPHIGLPNIIAGRRIVPELLQHEATGEKLAAEALRLLQDPVARAAMKAELQAVRAQLGEPGASARTARMALELAQPQDPH